MALHAELHRHLGGAVVPRIFWRFLVRHGHPLAERFPTYEECEAFFTRPRASLEEYLELHTVAERVAQMREVVRLIGDAGRQPEYPLLMRQILCMHSRLPYPINRAMLDLAASMPEHVCGVDLAGPDTLYAGRLAEFVELFQYARSLGLKTTCHLYETRNGCYPGLLPYLD